MSHAPHRSPRRRKAAPRNPLDFDTVELRHRHDGWTPQRQVDFIRALAECGCVDSACKRVGISTSAAYALRGRTDAQSFRFAWDAALDQAIQRLSDAAFSRAIHGVATPIFYKGEQIGEHRRYDEKLTMFLLRYRDPVRYGAWMDTVRAERSPDAATICLNRMIDQVEADAYAREAGDPLPKPFVRYQPPRFVSEAEQDAIEERAAAAREEAAHRAELRASDEAWERDLAAMGDAGTA